MESRLKQLFPAEEIHLAVNRLAAEIRHDYAGKTPVLIGILKGSFVFLSDLIRSLRMHIEIDFIRATSYDGKASTGNVKITKDIETNIGNRDIIVVEDVVDTGVTLDVILKHLKAKNPATLKLCALVDKLRHKESPIKIDYLGFRAKDGFLVGYGLDYNEKYRHLPEIYVME